MNAAIQKTPRGQVPLRVLPEIVGTDTARVGDIGAAATALDLSAAAAPAGGRTWVQRLRDADDTEVWPQFFGTFAPLAEGYCLRRGLAETDAADVRQEVFLTVTRAVQRLDPDTSDGCFRAWFFKVAHSRLCDFVTGRREVSARPWDPDELLAEAVEPEASAVWLRDHRWWLFEQACARARTEFEESTWKAFWSTSVEQRSGGEVAALLGLSVGAVYIAKSRVLTRLKEIVGKAAWPVR